MRGRADAAASHLVGDSQMVAFDMGCSGQSQVRNRQARELYGVYRIPGKGCCGDTAYAMSHDEFSDDACDVTVRFNVCTHGQRFKGRLHELHPGCWVLRPSPAARRTEWGTHGSYLLFERLKRDWLMLTPCAACLLARHLRERGGIDLCALALGEAEAMLVLDGLAWRQPARWDFGWPLGPFRDPFFARTTRCWQEVFNRAPIVLSLSAMRSSLAFARHRERARLRGVFMGRPPVGMYIILADFLVTLEGSPLWPREPGQAISEKESTFLGLPCTASF